MDLDDFIILKSTFGNNPLLDNRADFDLDGDVDLDDFIILKQNFGRPRVTGVAAAGHSVGNVEINSVRLEVNQLAVSPERPAMRTQPRHAAIGRHPRDLHLKDSFDLLAEMRIQPLG
ncbi:MAG: hypothetical protein ACOC95_00865 [Planctomycetota bacterium]